MRRRNDSSIMMERRAIIDAALTKTEIGAIRNHPSIARQTIFIAI